MPVRYWCRLIFTVDAKRHQYRLFSTLDGTEYNSARRCGEQPRVVMFDLLFQALWILAFFRRPKTIGGPLLVFFVQVFVSVPLLLLLITSVLFAWKKLGQSEPLLLGKPKFYGSLLILAMSLAAITATALAAIALLKTRSWHYVVYVRGGLCAVAVLAIVNLLYHRPNIANCLELIFPFVFLPYFFLSKRVQRAFPNR